MDVEIRVIEEKDYEAVAALLKRDLWNDTIDTDFVVHFFERVKEDGHYITFVASLDGNVIGFISAAMLYWASSDKRNMFIQGFVVRKEYQHKGVGTKIIQHVENYAKAQGIAGIGLQSGNQRTWAHAFYERNGYKKSNYFYKNF